MQALVAVCGDQDRGSKVDREVIVSRTGVIGHPRPQEREFKCKDALVFWISHLIMATGFPQCLDRQKGSVTRDKLVLWL